MKEINNFISYLTYEKKYSEHTINSYKNSLLDFNLFIDKEGLKILEIDHKVLRNYLKELYEKKLSSKSICLYISSLRSFYKFLIRKNYIKHNPTTLLKNPKIDKPTPKFLYYNELEEIYSSMKQDTDLNIRNILIIELLYSTGVRVSELVNIKLGDINYNDMSIRILGKGSKERIVLYGNVLKERLDSYLKISRENLAKKDNIYLLVNKNGDKLTDRGVREILNEIIKKSSLKKHVSPHILRHTFATHMLNEGADLKIVGELLGHISLKSTQVYTHVTDEHLRKVYLTCHPRKKE